MSEQFRENHFLILSREGAERYKVELPHVCISIRDPKTEKATLYPNLTRLDALYLDFWDVDREHSAIGIDEDVVFNKKHAKEILDFFIKYAHQVDTFVINCEAGISRSAAVGAALAKIHGYDNLIFFKKFLPNSLVYGLLLIEWHEHYQNKFKSILY